MEQLLLLFKTDLGLMSSTRDDYFNKKIISSQKELESKGIIFDMENIEDIMLISDYATWQYRNRNENVELPKHLLFRIRNRIVKARSEQ